MSNLWREACDEYEARLNAAYARAIAEGALPEGALIPPCTTPKDLSHGDLASSFALSAAKMLKCPPRQAAEAIAARLDLSDSCLCEPSVAGAGFINVRFSPKWRQAILQAVLSENEQYGRSSFGAGKRVMVEFVSANPTGPMTIGNARGGVLGDTLSSVLEAAGYDVWREFYLNDAGNQVEKLGESLEARFLQALGQEIPFPEDGYHGDYVTEFAQAYLAEHGDSLKDLPSPERRKTLAAYVLPRNVSRMEEDLQRYGIRFDKFFPESCLYADGYVDDTMRELTKNGYTYEKDGALWFKATEFGCEKDDVLRKSNGFYTYYAVDIAYHRDKFVRRGFDTVIDVLGADHHGHTIRFRAGMAALGLDPQRLQFVLMQLVRLTRDGEVVRMSKRTGKAITLGDLLDEIPVDAARFFFNMRQPDTHLEFDMGLAVRTDSDNPVYYVQYAHARLCSLLRLIGEETGTGYTVDFDASLLTDETERDLLRGLALFPESLAAAAREREPSKVNQALVELAGRFHRFYNACRIKEAEPALRDARLALSDSTRVVLRNGLKLLGISAPEKM